MSMKEIFLFAFWHLAGNANIDVLCKRKVKTVFQHDISENVVPCSNIS